VPTPSTPEALTSRNDGPVVRAADLLRSSGARDGLLVLGCSIVGHLGNYLFYVVAARALSPAQFADVSAMTALATIAFLPAGGVQAAAARDTAMLLAAGQHDEADALVGWLARRLALVQVCLVAVLVLATPAAVAALGLTSWSVWLVGVAWLVLGLGLPVGLGPLQGRARFGVVGAVMAGPTGALRPLLLVPGVAIGGVAGALAALVAATLVGLVGVVATLWRALRRGVGRHPLTGVLPAMAALTAFASLTNADVIAAKIVLEPTEAGFYASASLLGKIALYAPSALALVLLPKVTTRLHTGRDVRAPALFTMGATLATGALVTATILIAPPALAELVFGPGYAPAHRLAGPIAAVMTLASLLQVHIMMAFAARRQLTLWLIGAAALAQLVGLAVWADTAGQVVLVTAVSAGTALLAEELLSPYGAVRLLRGRGPALRPADP
jgi:O-antigen/teichoic acid export membrane protein